MSDLNHVAWARSMIGFIRERGLEEEFKDWCGGWPCRVASIAEVSDDDIIDLYQKGKTFDQIAEEVGLAKSAVHARLKKRGLTATRKRVKWNANMRNELIGLRAIKAPMSTIAKRLKVSRSAIYAELKRMGDSQPT